MSKMKTDSKVVFSAEGYTNDLLQISEAHNMKRTSLVYFNPISKEIGDEVITVSIDSDNEALTFPIFDKMINKKIRVTVETIDDNDSIKGNDSKDSVNVSTEIDDDELDQLSENNMFSKEIIENAAEKYSAFRSSSATDTKLDITTVDLKDVEKIAFIRGCEFIIKNIQKEV